MLRSARTHAGLQTARPGRRVAHNLVASLAITTILVGAGAGCAKHETKDADIITSISASSDSGTDSVPTFDSRGGYTPTGNSKLDTFCTGLAELDGNTIIQNPDLSLKIRVVVLLRVIQDAVPHAPAEVAAATATVRDFLQKASEIDTQQLASAEQRFLQLANSTGVAAPLKEFLTYVRKNCGFTLDVDPTTHGR